MSLANDLLSGDVLENLVGVADLKGGDAVHAVAGKRSSYMPISFVGGDANALARHYLRLGVRNFYAADLDAIEFGILQTELIESLLDQRFSTFLLDLGWSGAGGSLDSGRSQKKAGLDQGRLQRWVEQYPELLVVAASESVPDLESIAELSRIVPSNRIVLGLDHLGSELLGKLDLEDWLAASTQLGIERFLVLDLSSVGTRSGPVTIGRCRAIADRLPRAVVYSGGGIRHADDVRTLVKGGCRYSLVATALHPRSAAE